MQLGEKLREARLEKDLTIEDIQKETKIQKRYLESLEENDWSAMPGNFYVRAFVREYAEVVGLNGDELLVEHSEELPTSNDKSYEYFSPSRSSRTSSGPSPVFKFLPKILVIILIVAIAFAIYYAVINFIDSDSPEDEVVSDDPIIAPDDEETEGSQSENEDETTDDSEHTTSQPDEEEEQADEPKLEVVETDANNARTTYQLTNAEQLDITFESNGESWLEVYGDGEPEENYFYGMINTENSPIEPNISESEVRILVGRAHEVTITVNGNELDYELEPDTESWQYVKQAIVIKLNNE